MIVYISLSGFYAQRHLNDRPLVVIRDRSVLDVNMLALVAGAKVGMSLVEAKSILAKNPRQITPAFVEWNADDYADSQRAWLDTCVPFTDVIEPLDQHQALLDLSAHPSPSDLISQLPIAPENIGVGHTVWMARVALGDEERFAYYAPNAFLDQLPTQSLSPISLISRQRLEFLGYRTAGDIQRIPFEVLRQQFGNEAHTIQQSALGRGGLAVRPRYPNVSMADRVYFESPVDLREPIDLAIDLMSRRLSERLMSADLQTSRVRLWITSESCPPELRERTFSKPLQSANNLRFAASTLSSVTDPVSLVRMELLDIRKASRRQNSLYVLRSEGAVALDSSVKQVQKLFGQQSIQRGSDLKLTRRQRLMREWKDATGWS